MERRTRRGVVLIWKITLTSPEVAPSFLHTAIEYALFPTIGYLKTFLSLPFEMFYKKLKQALAEHFKIK